MLPGRGVAGFSVVFGESQELVCGVRIKTQVDGICTASCLHKLNTFKDNQCASLFKNVYLVMHRII